MEFGIFSYDNESKKGSAEKTLNEERRLHVACTGDGDVLLVGNVVCSKWDAMQGKLTN